jgi:hypothetical protein
MTYRILLALGTIGIVGTTLGTSGCVTGKGVGDLDTESGSDTTDGPEPTTSATPTDTDTGEPAVCPDVDVACTISPSCEGEGCGDALSLFDADGCPRPACGESDGPCPDGRVCLQLDDWGYCSSTGWGCDLEGDECVCTQTNDCQPGVAYCIPEDVAPADVARCLPSDPGDAFAIEPSLSETTGIATCMVASVEPLQLDCTGDFVGAHTVTVNSTLPAAFTVGETVTLEHYARPQIEWLDQWLRILDDQGHLRVFAVQATEILPPDAPAEFWTSPQWDVSTVDIGCLVASCGPDGGTGVTGLAIRVSIGEAVEYAGGEFGGLPGKFGGEMGHVTVHEARQGACGANLGDQPGWVSFSIVDILG